MSAKLKSVIFIVILCVVCSIILTFGATFLKAPQERNAKLDRQINILQAANIMPQGKVSPDQVREIYAARIGEFWVGENGGLVAAIPDANPNLHVYTIFDDAGQNVEQVVLPFSVQGVWGPIHGYLALATDLDTVTGFTVYDNKETAGLGAEIAQEWFQNQWRGKKLYNAENNLLAVIIAKGPVLANDPLQAHTVDGISGATATGRALMRGLQQQLMHDLPLLQHVEWNNIKR